MTNTGLKALFTKYGNRVYLIQLDNERRIFIGYPNQDNSPQSHTDFIYDAFDGTDFFGFKHKVPGCYDDKNVQLEVVDWYPTDQIQYVGVMESDFEDYRPNVHFM